MTDYRENPKMTGSGLYGCIPQTEPCPNDCADCFFNHRSFLEPLKDHLPNMPREMDIKGNTRVVRVNDGHDSFYLTTQQIERCVRSYPMCFFNTSIPNAMEKYCEYHHTDYRDYRDWTQLYPVELTINPGKMTDAEFYMKDPIPINLMSVRFRVNMWNLDLCDKAVQYYTTHQVPVILTFMAYYTQPIPKEFEYAYEFRKRTINSYWAIKRVYWKQIMERYEDNRYVYSCGHDGAKEDGGNTECRFCGNCLREFFVTSERLQKIADVEAWDYQRAHPPQFEL